jgi:hypothetical protein
MENAEMKIIQFSFWVHCRWFGALSLVWCIVAGLVHCRWFGALSLVPAKLNPSNHCTLLEFTNDILMASLIASYFCLLFLPVFEQFSISLTCLN